MADQPLVLSLFPGIGLLDHAFELEGFCVVRGPDVLWGGDVRRFHPPAGRFDGVIGGPPCQLFTQLRYLNPLAGQKHGNLIPEYERVVEEAQPSWFLMENVPSAPEPVVDGYEVHSLILNNRWLGEVQDRTRRFSLGSRDGKRMAVEVALFESQDYRQAVTRSLRAVPVKLGGSGKVKRTYTEDGKRHGPSVGNREKIAEMLRLQGMPEDYLDEAPFTDSAKRLVIGNGVPIPMGRAIARAVRRALGLPIVSEEAAS
jgi:DNA (cytosine-5)-methyltransferase 1